MQRAPISLRAVFFSAGNAAHSLEFNQELS